ncbi:MAG: [FeFe] hydrogenase H-cluster radical SAM maturase HydE [Spirochaetales bacterium]|nr:[FeFe] hydrogenase H-cluster radical SAM maturase HydE [Spirochaetales bacterium]
MSKPSDSLGASPPSGEGRLLRSNGPHPPASSGSVPSAGREEAVTAAPAGATAPMSKEQAFSLFFRRDLESLAAEARRIASLQFGDAVYLRGLIEFTNHCAADCLYCGIRRSNPAPRRYRLTDDEILHAVDEGFERGLRTFVLQGGEDAAFDTQRLARLCTAIKERSQGEAALTLSCGIRSLKDYKALKSAGADRYLMRFETSDPQLHQYLRNGSTLQRRLKALYDLKDAGFQVGSGFMVGLPGESDEVVLRNVELCAEMEVDMAGVGPFIPHPETPLAESEQVGLERALYATALLRILCPQTHIPATTAAGSLQKDGRERMIACGANVLMPNLTPVSAKKDYLLYPGKICLDESGLQCVGCLSMRVRTVDREISFDRADGRAGGPRQPVLELGAARD